jgi:hypothetical protein
MNFSSDYKNLAILSLITVSIWIVYEIYYVYNKSSVPEVFAELTLPLEPELNTNLLNSLKDRKDYY